MYTLVKMADVVQIHPSEFQKSSIRAIEDFINNKYADKVIHKVGLCLGFHSLVSHSEGQIGHGDGIVNVNVDFRLVVFRPFQGEILRARIETSDPRGIYLDMDFFNDIFVPPELLFDNTSYGRDDEGHALFIWNSDDGEGNVNQFFFDHNEEVLFRVEREIWHDLTPQMQRPEDYGEEGLDQDGNRIPPYRIVGSMMHSGCGPTLWWEGGEEEPETNGDVSAMDTT